MTITIINDDVPQYISRGEWDLTPSTEERIEKHISGRLEKEGRKIFFKSMNMGCFE